MNGVDVEGSGVLWYLPTRTEEHYGTLQDGEPVCGLIFKIPPDYEVEYYPLAC